MTYRTNTKFRDYLDTVDARRAMMVACVKRIYTHGLKCANAENTRKCDPEDVNDWLRRYVILSWRKMEATRMDMHCFMAEQVKPAVAYFGQLKSERAPSNSRAGPPDREYTVECQNVVNNRFDVNTQKMVENEVAQRRIMRLARQSHPDAANFYDPNREQPEREEEEGWRRDAERRFRKQHLHQQPSRSSGRNWDGGYYGSRQRVQSEHLPRTRYEDYDRTAPQRPQ